MRVAYSGDIVTYNKRRSSFLELFKQIFTYGEVRPQKESFIETLKKPFFLVPSLFVVGIIVFFILSIFNSPLWLIPLDLYLILGLFFSSIESIKNKNLSYFFILPWIFLTIHVGYGLGMIWGYLKKI